MKKIIFIFLFFLSLGFVSPVFATETITIDIGTSTPTSAQPNPLGGCIYQSFVASTSWASVTKLGWVTSMQTGSGTFRAGIATSTAGCFAGVYVDLATSTGWLSFVDVVNSSTNSSSTVTVYDIPDVTVTPGITYWAKICNLNASSNSKFYGYTNDVNASSSYVNVNSTANCNVINRDMKLTVWQDGSAPVTCSSWTYSGWGDCASDNNQWRSVVASYPSGCSGGSPVVSQPCIFNALIASTSVSSLNYNQIGYFSTESCVSTSTGYCLQWVKSSRWNLNFFDVLFLSIVLAMPFLLYFLYKRLRS